MADPRPLWEVIDQAWWRSVDTEDPHCSPPASDQAADVILAVRDWLVPQEEEPYPAGYPAEIRQRERMRLRALLTAEAHRAERGETINPGEHQP